MNIFRSKVDVFEAINRCDWQKVKDAVVPGKANQRDGQYDATLLHWTVNEGHVQTVEHLLACGAEVGARDGKHSATPLHWAGAKGHVFVVRLLMMREADVNSRDSSNRTPLHWAAGNGQLGVIRELLFWGARVECTDSWEKIPLHWAAFRGHVASVEELVGRGSPVVKADADGNLPGDAFHSSVSEESRKAIRTAMKQGPASGDSVVRAATVSSELLLETLRACRSWGELFENRQFEQLSKECQDHRERLRGFIQGLADQGKAESLEQCLKAMDLLNSALGLHEDMRNGTKPVPLEGVEHGRRRPSDGSLGGRDAQHDHDSGSAGPPMAGGEMRSAEDLREFLAPALGGGGGARPLTIGDDGAKGGTRDSGSGAGSSAASLRLYQLPAVREACGGFDPERCIGEGGFGKVYRGSMMGLPVAVKKLDETGLQGREQFFREVEVLSTCRHENIVPLLGVCTEPPCLVYRLMPNNSLRHHLDDPALRSRLGWRLRVAMTMQMCSGLDYLHSESTNKPKVIHGDIKPENILLDEYLKARLSDFGISRVGESEAGGTARSRARRGAGRPAEGGSRGVVPPEADGLQGTFGYMDPVYQSTGRLDERSDVYSLGVVMLELLTGDPVYCPDKEPPGLVDRVRKALEDRTLKNVVDRSAVWNKAAAKAYARLACACCAEDPANRPSLREVLEKVEAIQEMGNKNAGAGAPESSRSVDLLQLFDPEHNDQVGGTAVNGGHSVGAVVGMGGSVGTGDSSGHGGLARDGAIPANFGASLSKGNSSVPMQQPRPPPPPPPPPYQSTIRNLASASTEPPTYMEAVAAEGKREAVTDGYSTHTTAGVTTAASPLVAVSPGTRVSSGGISTAEDMSTVTMRYTANDAHGSTATGAGTAAWWSASSATGSGRGGSRGAAGTVGGGASAEATASGGKAEGLSSHSQRHPLMAPLLRGSSVFAGGDQGVGAVSCTRSTSLAEYDVDLPGVLQAAMGGGVLSSNARLLCVCCAGPPPEAADRDMRPSPEASATLPPAERQGQVAKQEAGHVSVMDLWHRGRTVRYPAAADKAAMSPNQSESVIAVFGGGSLHVFSIPRRLLLQELAVATELVMWRWLSPWGLALVTRNAVFYWSVTETVSHVSSSPGNDGIARSSSGEVSGGGKEQPGEATHEVDAAARLRRPRQAFQRRRTLTAPGSPHRVYDYQASADGRWGMLLCAVVDSESGGSGVQVGDAGSPPLNNGYVGNSGDADGLGGPVKVDLYSFERGQTFEFEVLGATLMTMPGSNPPLNLLALVIRGDGSGAELRVLDLDRSLAQAEGPEALSRLASQGEGWIIATTHVIAEEDLRGSAAYRIVDRSGESAAGRIPMAAPLVSPPVFLRQWTENTNVLFMVGCHGLLLLLDVVTGAELARAQACVPPVVEAEVDPDVGDLVVVSSADGGGIHRLTVRALALRESVEYDHKDAEMATRVSAMTGYSGVRPVSTLRRQV